MNTPMQKIIVTLPHHHYPIFIGKQLITDANLIKPFIQSKQVCVVTNDTIASLYLKPLTQLLKDYQCDHYIIKDGERYKTLDTFAGLIDFLLINNHHRDSTIIALGGGVIGDLSGFAAACYQRGMPYLNIPTTLLAQVDAAIGGKTAVNHPHGKNMIGAFHQPQAVIIDIDTLQTLPDREFIAGLAEVIKYGLLRDATFFTWLENNMTKLLARNQDALIHTITCCCEMKAEIVALDEKENASNGRALLNLGHSFAHVIETHTGYNQYLHGEAVAIGLVMAAKVSCAQTGLDQAAFERINALLIKAKLPTQPPSSIDPTQWLTLMKNDKKVRQGEIRLVLLRSIGQAFTQTCTSLDDIFL